MSGNPPPLSFPYLQDTCWHRNTHLEVQSHEPLLHSGRDCWSLLKPRLCPAFPIRQYTSWHFSQESCCKTLYRALCSSLTLVSQVLWSTITKKASMLTCLFPSCTTCLTTHRHSCFSEHLYYEGPVTLGIQEIPQVRCSQLCSHAEGLFGQSMLRGLPAAASAYFKASPPDSTLDLIMFIWVIFCNMKLRGFA